MEDKYNLTPEQSVFLAKKTIKENVYSGVKLEGINLTFPDTQAILDGVNVPSATIDEIQTILNMRDAWKYVLKTLNDPFTLDYACKVNSYVARNESLDWGVLRYGSVGIGGTDYKPPMPERRNVEENIKKIMDWDVSITEKAIHYFVWGSKQQLFWDGNKRTSLICANKILLQHGHGILTIRDNNSVKFNKLLTKYYEEETGNTNYNNLVNFLYENGLEGIEFAKQPYQETEMQREMRMDRMDMDIER